MRRITSALFAAVGLTAGLSQAALAADLPQRPAPAPLPVIAPAPTWTGCYVGGNIGGAFGNASLSLAGPRALASLVPMGTAEQSPETIRALLAAVRSAAIMTSAAVG